MINSFLKSLWTDKFKRYLLILLIIVGILMWFKVDSVEEPTGDGIEMHFFFSPSCPHCADQKEFHKELIKEFPDLNIISHDVTRHEEVALLKQFAEEKGKDISKLGVPATFIGEYAIIGFNTAETTGKNIKEAIKGTLEEVPVSEKTTEEFELPIIGKINIKDYSLPGLAVILGLIDGFNPCAMWALVFLISLMMGLKDKRKLWLLVGSFVFASGALYFLFMSAWLNVFLLIGYLRPVTILVGIIAIFAGLTSIREYIKARGAIVCPVSKGASKSGLMEKMKKIVESPLTWFTVIGIIALAFVVNSIEFVCSSAIPVVFTQTLALHSLSTIKYYGYILLYDFFFMLDDLVIFSLAAFAVTHIGDRYAKYCTIIGAVLLLALGLILLFAPNLLG